LLREKPSERKRHSRLSRIASESRAARPKGAKRDDGANEGSRPKEDDSEEIAAVRGGATSKAIPASPRGTSSRRFVKSLAARPRGAKRNDGAHDGGRPKEDDSEETAAGRDGATRKAIPASPRGTKRDGGKNDRTGGGGRPKNPTSDLDSNEEELDAGDIGDLDDDDEDPDYGDIEDDEGPEDEGKTAPVKDRAQGAAGGAAARRWTEDVARSLTSVGRCRPTTLMPITQADVDDDKATNGGRRRPTTVTDAAGVDDDEVTSGGRRRPTTAMTVADVANVDDDEATTGGRRRPTANVNNDEAAIEGRHRPTKALPAGKGGETPRPTIVVETVDKDGSSGTGEEFSLASEDDFASKEEEDDEEEDPTAPPPRHISEPPDERQLHRRTTPGPTRRPRLEPTGWPSRRPRPEPTGEPSREALVDNPRDPTEKKRSSRPRVTVLPME
jgi:hypothetical protein